MVSMIGIIRVQPVTPIYHLHNEREKRESFSRMPVLKQYNIALPNGICKSVYAYSEREARKKALV